MKVATDKISHFFVISCLVHTLILWGLDARTVRIEEQRIAPTIHFVFDNVAPTINQVLRPVHPQKEIRPRKQRGIVKCLPKEHISAHPSKAWPKVVTTPASLPKNEPQPAPVEEVTVHGILNYLNRRGFPTPPKDIAGQECPAYPRDDGNTRERLPEDVNPGQLKQDILDSYLAIIRTILERNKDYPLWARRNNWEGTVQLRFIVLRDGIVENIRVIGSSGFSVLDQAAERTIRRIPKFPGIPKEVAMDRLSLDVPLVFRLVNR